VSVVSAADRAQDLIDRPSENDAIFKLHDQDEHCAQIFFAESSGFDVHKDEGNPSFVEPVPNSVFQTCAEKYVRTMDPATPIRVCASCGIKGLDNDGKGIISKNKRTLDDVAMLQTEGERLRKFVNNPDIQEYYTIVNIAGVLYDLHEPFLEIAPDGTVENVPLCNDCDRLVEQGLRPTYNVGNGYDFGNISTIRSLTSAESQATAACIRFQTVVKFRGTEEKG
jgi:hypothetical protein